MPSKASKRDQRIEALKKMRGVEFVMANVASDFVLLAKQERAAAVRMLTALNDTIATQEVAAAGLRE